VDAVAAMLGLEDLLERRPAALSGGQRQRVAMAARS
jgi:ABC-type sugar transport system ATPase subunit